MGFEIDMQNVGFAMMFLLTAGVAFALVNITYKLKAIKKEKQAISDVLEDLEEKGKANKKDK